MNQHQTIAFLGCMTFLKRVFSSALLIVGASAAAAPIATQDRFVAAPLPLPAQAEGVLHLETNLPSTFNGMVVNDFLGASTFYNAGITGQNTIAANIEAGHVWDGHETLGHISTFVHDTEAFGSTTADLYDRHATWVGMMTGGRNGGTNQGTWQTGISPDADFRSGAIASSWSGAAYSRDFDITANSFTTPFAAYFGTADVVNSSWGFADPEGSNAFTIAMDGLAYQSPKTTFVVSAGNSGPGANSVGSPGAGYNAITVGALGNANSFDSVASFSSRGPQDYADPVNGTVPGVRAAVDIAAPGTSLVSAYYGGQTGGNNPSLTGSPSGGSGGPDYYSSGLGGTSFASPIVAGGVILIDSASYNTGLAANPQSRDARVVKAVLMNSADKTPGWDNGQVANANGGVTTSQALDYNVGAGRMNLDRAYSQYLAGTTDVPGTITGNAGIINETGWDYGAVNNGGSTYYFFDDPLLGGSNLTLTLAWMRDRDFDTATLNVYDNAQANLDLFFFDATGGIIGTTISTSNSVYNVAEHLSFSVPSTGFYGIGVDFTSMLFGTQSTVNYGLAWSGIATVIPEPNMLVLAGLMLTLVSFRRGRKN